MTVALAATLLTAADPQPVQLVLSGLTAADTYRVVGTCGDWQWSVPGGIGTSVDGSNIVLIDNRAPLNGAVTYSALVNGTEVTSDPVTVNYADGYVLQNLRGDRLAAVFVDGYEDAREMGIRANIFRVAGRTDPVGRYDVATSDSFSLTIHALGTDSATVKAMLKAGGPVVLRRTVGDRDVPPTEILLPLASGNQLMGPLSTMRGYNLNVHVVGDPQPFTALVAFDWDDFDTFYGSMDWDGFDAAWAGLTWDDLDTADWGAL